MTAHSTGHVIPLRQRRVPLEGGATGYTVTFYTAATAPGGGVGWNDAPSRAARAKRRKVVDAYLLAGKLPALTTWRPERMWPKGFKPGAVVIAGPLKYRPDEPLMSMLNRTRPDFDVTLTDAAQRYLDAVSRRVVQGRWACGCSGFNGHITPCKAHLGAIRGRDPNTGEYGE